eukprot:TRINITY_DN4946_c0_g2_i1.p1 TRINITY_DN4946_c0_g2~~TRINITY_DN4946_c0_g2_i1.p1  ORF type:complete len:183 (+),score=39.97 TRINITY_DN4946_c0_g2_i1:238-786(+)
MDLPSRRLSSVPPLGTFFSGLQALVSRSDMSKETFKELITEKGILCFIEDPLGFETFKKYLTKTSCSESLEFWGEVQLYKTVGNDQLVESARHIYTRYVARDSPQEINICSYKEEEITLKINAGIISHNMFDNAESEILKLMIQNNWVTFINSEDFDSFTESLLSGGFTRGPTPQSRACSLI